MIVGYGIEGIAQVAVKKKILKKRIDMYYVNSGFVNSQKV